MLQKSTVTHWIQVCFCEMKNDQSSGELNATPFRTSPKGLYGQRATLRAIKDFKSLIFHFLPTLLRFNSTKQPQTLNSVKTVHPGEIINLFHQLIWVKFTCPKIKFIYFPKLERNTRLSVREKP